MGVHVLATNLAQRGGAFEPQRMHNFTLEIAGLPGDNALDILTLSLRSGQLPNEANEQVEVPYGNERVWVAGKAVYEASEFTFADWVDRPTARILYDWRREVYTPVAGSIGLAATYKKTASIVLFGPNSGENDPTFQRVWTMIGLWPYAANFGNLDMSSSEQVMISIGFRYDKAILEVS